MTEIKKATYSTPTVKLKCFSPRMTILQYSGNGTISTTPFTENDADEDIFSGV